MAQPSPPSQQAAGRGAAAADDSDDDEKMEGLSEPPANSSSGYNADSREKYLMTQMEELRAEFTEQVKIRVFCGTWNVNAKKPTEDLAAWLRCDLAPEIYAIGFQEIVDLNAVNLVADHSAAKPWEDLIEKTLDNQYQLIRSQHLVGLSLSVFARREVIKEIKDVEDDTRGVGIMGLGGNKGAVAIRFRIYDSTVCIVNAHLAAHQINVQGRNQDYHNLMRRIQFTGGNSNPFDLNLKYVQPEQKTTIGIKDHDHCFWIGDLNYRLNLHNLEEVYSRIDVKDWPHLLEFDQLITEKKKENAFVGWEEALIDFGPTYKYQPGTDLYERREDKKKRCPAWCDRIQWTGEGIKNMFYRRAELKCSDHKPVMALFDVDAKKVIKEKRDKVYQRLNRFLDKVENNMAPKVSMSRNKIHFPNVHFDGQVSQKLLIENTGKSLVQFTFTPKLQENYICKRWLEVRPTAGIILPGRAAEITLTVQVTRETAQKLNSGEDMLDDILIMRLENGRDFFIEVTGDYNRSCFGSSIEYLVKTPAPVRFAQLSARNTKVLSLPKELWRVVDYIYRNGMDEENIFVASGNVKQIDSIRECLDTGQEFAAFDVYSMAETLIRFLNSLAEPVFPKALAAQYHESMNLTSWCKQALMKLSPAHYNVFIYMTAFLREVLKHKAKNKLTADKLVYVFAACLTQMDDQVLQGPTATNKFWTILKHFITSDDFV